jgi:enediyne biosynthesis thioesterase
MRVFEYRHVVTFEDTNVVGNVYFTKYLSWQGSCRELFLREHTPELFRELGGDLALVTVRCSCEFFDELRVCDEVVVVMTLQWMRQNRLAMGFDYAKTGPGPGVPVARGAQEVACMRRTDQGLRPEPIPEGLRRALDGFRGQAGGEERTEERTVEVAR